MDRMEAYRKKIEEMNRKKREQEGGSSDGRGRFDIVKDSVKEAFFGKQDSPSIERRPSSVEDEEKKDIKDRTFKNIRQKLGYD